MKGINTGDFDLAGRRYVLYSNFPMWLKGDKARPAFIYGYPNKGRFSDTVEYIHKGRRKTLQGTDTINGDHFVWRGRGLLWIARSVWRIVHLDEQNGIALIRFDKTLFTPAGYDLICRTPQPDQNTQQAIHKILAEYADVDIKLLQVLLRGDFSRVVCAIKGIFIILLH